MDQERENSATRYSGSHREGHDDHGRGSRGASPDEIGQDARSTKKGPSEGDDEELGVDEEMVDVDGVDGSDEGSDAMHKETPMNRGAQPANAPPRFDFHDFPRKTNQADVANAAVTAGGEAYVWGYAQEGNLGRGDDCDDAHVPERLKPTRAMTGKKVVAVSFGGQHTAALCVGGSGGDGTPGGKRART